MKKKSFYSRLFAVSLLFFQLPALAGTVLFRDDFNGPKLDAAKWSVGTWALGRSHFGNIPVIAAGIARLTFDTYQFKATEIYTKQVFNLDDGIEFNARVRLNNLPSGLVAALFTYAYNPETLLSDEIDIEILTKQINLSAGATPLLFSTWNDWDETNPNYNDGVHNASLQAYVGNLDINDFHTFTIRWLPGYTEWLVDGVLIESSDLAQPDMVAPFRINFWAPASGWSDAFDAGLKPVPNKKKNRRYYYDVDWVEIRQLP